MPKAPLLAEDEIEARLAEAPLWTRSGSAIERRFTFDDFRSAVEFLVQVAGYSDQLNHHPDVNIHWNEMTLTLWTHASGGLTEKDFALAETIDRLARA